MAFLSLSQGYVAIVDVEDLDYLKQWNWFINRCSKYKYARRKQRLGAGKWQSRNLHYEVLRLKVPLPKGKVIDHINHDTLDCRKGNLRVCSMAENSCNRRPRRHEKGTSKYKGVWWRKRYKRWAATIQLNKLSQWLGSFKDEYDAVLAYNAAAMKLHGPYAYLNHWDGPTCWLGEPALAPPGNPLAPAAAPGAGGPRSPHDIIKPPGVQLLFDFM